MQLRNKEKHGMKKLMPVIKKIRTPREAEDDARTGYFMQTGIMEYDELQVYGRIEGV